MAPDDVSDRLQALLARAAQEQLSEHRQASAVLADLRALVAGLEERLGSVAAADRLEQVAADVAALRREVDGLGQRLEDAERRLTTHVDDAVLALAEVLLRRRRPGGQDAVPEVVPPEVVAGPAPEPEQEPEQEPAALPPGDPRRRTWWRPAP